MIDIQSYKDSKFKDSSLSKDPKLKDIKLHITNITGNGVSCLFRKSLATFPGTLTFNNIILILELKYMHFFCVYFLQCTNLI